MKTPEALRLGSLCLCVFQAMPKGEFFKDKGPGGVGQGYKERNMEVFETMYRTAPKNMWQT